MSTNPSIVADGRSRLLEALRQSAPARKHRYQALLAEFETRHQDALQRAGFFRRITLRHKIKREVAATMRRECGLPSDGALFLLGGTRYY